MGYPFPITALQGYEHILGPVAVTPGFMLKSSGELLIRPRAQATSEILGAKLSHLDFELSPGNSSVQPEFRPTGPE